MLQLATGAYAASPGKNGLSLPKGNLRI